MFSKLSSNKMTSAMIGSCAIIVCLAIAAQAQYNTFDSDSNSELGKLMRNSANLNRYQNQANPNVGAAATRNLYNRQQPLQYAPTQHRRNYGSAAGASADGLNGGYSPFVNAAASNGRSRNSEANDDDDGEGSGPGGNFGPNFGANFDNDNDGEGSGAETPNNGMGLNQAASGYPGQGSEYNNQADSFGAGFNFGPSSADGSSDDFSGDGRRAKSASAPGGARGFNLDGDESGALPYGPNSAVNYGERDADEEGRANFAPEAQDNDNDDE